MTGPAFSLFVLSYMYILSVLFFSIQTRVTVSPLFFPLSFWFCLSFSLLPNFHSGGGEVLARRFCQKMFGRSMCVRHYICDASVWWYIAKSSRTLGVEGGRKYIHNISVLFPFFGPSYPVSLDTGHLWRPPLCDQQRRVDTQKRIDMERYYISWAALPSRPDLSGWHIKLV